MSNISYKYPNDKELVKQVLKGDSQAFGMIIKNTERLVAQITFKMIGDAEDRKDIAQDIYLKAFKNLAGFKFQSKLSTWIGQIAFNTCFSYLEKKKLLLPENHHAEETDSDDILEVLALKSPGLQSVDYENDYLKKDVKRIVFHELEKLSPIFRTLITLFHYEELTYEEIGTITGLPEGTIKSYLFRARKSLKDNILLKYKKRGIIMTEHISEIEIQQYALDRNSCEKSVLEHVISCRDCQLKAELYATMIAGIKQHPVAEFDFNLSELVLAQLPQAKPQTRKSDNTIIFLAAGAIILAGFAIFYYMGFSLTSFFSGVAAISVSLIFTIVACVCIFLGIDMYNKYQKQIRALDIS